MAADQITVKYKLLAKYVTNDAGEFRRYRCSECGDDIFNINLHAQFSHNTLKFEVEPGEIEVEHEPPFHPCGVLGCILAPHEQGIHSWQALPDLG